MQITDLPPKFPIPWANAASATYKRAIPTASQIGIVAGEPSLTDGWVPLNAQPIAGGGIPPDIRDENGILNQVTAWSRWFSAGGPISYDAGFASGSGGYPRGAVLASATFGQFWLCTADSNMTNPDASGANWSPLFLNEMGQLASATSGGTANAITITIPGVTAIGLLTNIPIQFMASINNTAPTTLSVNGLTASNILQGGTSLNGGEIVANWPYTVVYNSGSFHVTGSGAGAVNVGNPIYSAHAVNLGQFSNTNASNGVLRLPTGIIQFGSGQTTQSGQTINFPVAFPNACQRVVVGDGGISPVAWAGSGITPTGFNGYTYKYSGGDWNPVPGGVYSYIAVGY